uniref:Brain chitinase and chia n=1 Tax=Steinernema glaseri TaxID=37863 RepID=A0A1I7Z1G1_9BILA
MPRMKEMFEIVVNIRSFRIFDLSLPFSVSQGYPVETGRYGRPTYYSDPWDNPSLLRGQTAFALKRLKMKCPEYVYSVATIACSYKLQRLKARSYIRYGTKKEVDPDS